MNRDVKFFWEISLYAHPTSNALLYDGWFLRFTGGYTNRANFVSVLYPSELAYEEKILAYEELYKQQNCRWFLKLPH